MARISILLPTRERPHLVRRLFDSLAMRTDSLNDLEVILYLDDDDETSHDISEERFSVIKIIGPRASMGAYNTGLPQPRFWRSHHVDERRCDRAYFSRGIARSPIWLGQSQTASFSPIPMIFISVSACALFPSARKKLASFC